MSETIQDKADRYLLQGRVVVVSAEKDHGSFSVLGSDNEPYAVVYKGDWMCDCPARVTVCAHVVACQKISKFEAGRKLSFNTKEDSLSDLISKALA